MNLIILFYYLSPQGYSALFFFPVQYSTLPLKSHGYPVFCIKDVSDHVSVLPPAYCKLENFPNCSVSLCCWDPRFKSDHLIEPFTLVRCFWSSLTFLTKA